MVHVTSHHLAHWQSTGSNDVKIDFNLPEPFVSGATSVTFAASSEDSQNTLKGSFVAKLQLDKSEDAVDINVQAELVRVTNGKI